MTPVGALRAVRRRWWLPVALVIIAVIAVLAIGTSSAKAQTQYKAKTILIQNPNGNQSQPVNLQEAALEATVGTVPATAAKALGYTGNPASLAGQVTVTPDATVGTLTIEVDGPDGNHDALVANAFATALNQVMTQTAVAAYQSQVAQVENRLKSLQAQINQYEGLTDPVSEARLGSAEDQYRLDLTQFQQLADQGQPSATFAVLQNAVPVAQGGIHPPASRKARLAIGGFVALIVGLGLAVGVDTLYPRINDRDDAEREFGTVVLAEVPSIPRRQRASGMVQSLDAPGLESFHEAYRMVRSAIFLFSTPDAGAAPAEGGGGPQIILVTSPLPAEGKSTTVANLALTMAESGRRALICNVDFRAPRVARMMGLVPALGLTDLLTSGRDSSLADIVCPTEFERVSLVHSGRDVRDAAHLIASRGRGLVEEARQLADVVLLDTAPLLVVSDSSELLPVADAVVMVARAGRTTRDSARRANEMLARAGIPVLGVVLVGARAPISSYYDGHYGRRYAESISTAPAHFLGNVVSTIRAKLEGGARSGRRYTRSVSTGPMRRIGNVTSTIRAKRKDRRPAVPREPEVSEPPAARDERVTSDGSSLPDEPAYISPAPPDRQPPAVERPRYEPDPWDVPYDFDEIEPDPDPANEPSPAPAEVAPSRRESTPDPWWTSGSSRFFRPGGKSGS